MWLRHTCATAPGLDRKLCRDAVLLPWEVEAPPEAAEARRFFLFDIGSVKELSSGVAGPCLETRESFPSLDPGVRIVRTRLSLVFGNPRALDFAGGVTHLRSEGLEQGAGPLRPYGMCLQGSRAVHGGPSGYRARRASRLFLFPFRRRTLSVGVASGGKERITIKEIISALPRRTL